MNDLRTVAQQALEAWDNDENGTLDHPLSGAMETLRAALEQPDRAQEQNTKLDKKLSELSERRLNDEIIAELWYRNGTYHHHFARAIEAWLKGKEYDKR